MNRIVLIGNGFDLAHGLKTSYQDFMNWYWDQRMHAIESSLEKSSSDCLCEISLSEKSQYNCWNVYFNGHQIQLKGMDGWSIIQTLLKQGIIETSATPFFTAITTRIETRGWVDIENEYYMLLKKVAFDKNYPSNSITILNEQLAFLQDLLVKYLKSLDYFDTHKKELKNLIYSPILEREVAVNNLESYYDYICSWLNAKGDALNIHLDNYNPIYGYRYGEKNQIVQDIKNKIDSRNIIKSDHRSAAHVIIENLQFDCSYLPKELMLVNFNYTPNAEQYWLHQDGFQYVNIHGNLEHPESIMLGYGDELDEQYKAIQDKNENEYLKYFKSTRYMESNNYRKILQFADSDKFQIYILGHSCGNSDRTLLNTLFEHDNCVSIKPYYYIRKDGTDNYMEIVQNIARNFQDMKKMRDRVVNKTYTEAFSDDSKN